jgi:hypothetical protein
MAGSSPAKTSRRSRFPFVCRRKIFPGQPCASSAEAERLRQSLLADTGPYGRGRGAATHIPANPVADRPAAGTARAGMTGGWGLMRQPTTAEVRLDEGKAACSGAARRAARRFGCQRDRLRSNFVATHLGQTEDRAQQPGYPGDVGWKRAEQGCQRFVVGDDAEYAFVCTMISLISLWEGARA